MKIYYRQAVLKDIKEMQALFVNTIQNVCQKDYDKQQIEVWTRSIENQDRWISLINEQYVLLAIDNKTIVGFISLLDNNYIDFLYVHTDYLLFGIASDLFGQIEEKAIVNGATSLMSDVSKTAKSFFEKKGFKVLKEQENFIKDVVLVNYKMEKLLRK